jgi:hypothetical protein
MYVAFVDLLGFASAVEQLSGENISAFANLVSETVSTRDRPPASIMEVEPAVRDLYNKYIRFQLRSEIVCRQLARFNAHAHFRRNLQQPLNASLSPRPSLFAYKTVVFSDSIFFAATEIEPVLDCAVELIVDLLVDDVAARGGIAKGEFHTFEWNLRAGQTESFSASSPFLGSGVIRAFRTESRGPRGLRLIIHESCREDVRSMDSWAAVDLLAEEASDEWRAEANLGLADFSIKLGLDHVLKRLRALGEKAPPAIRSRHFDPTALALGRMNAVLQGGGDRCNTRIYDWRDDD